MRLWGLLWLAIGKAGSMMALCLSLSWGQGSLRISAYPTATVADGNSTIILTAEARTAQGKPVPDGTQIAFTTTLGNFREAIVSTEGGRARATLVAGQLPGTAIITATVLGQALTGETQVLFVSSLEELRTATDYVQVLGKTYLAYANEQRIISASGEAQVRFGFATITADDLQLEVDSLRVKARNATLQYGSEQQTFTELMFELRSTTGYGIYENEGRWQVVRIQHGQTTPYTEPVSPEWFRFADLSLSELVIKGSQIWFYPGERIQFHRAEFYIGEVKVLSLPLYSHSLWGTTVGTDTFFGIQSGQLYLDVPYYYALKPGQIGALRLRTAQRTSRGVGSARGLFLDLEHEYRWGLGNGMLSISSLARDDWGVQLRHYQPLSQSTRVHLWLDSPAHQGLYGSLQLSHQARGYSTGLTLTGSTFWKGSNARSLRTELFVEGTPQQVRGLPFRQSLSLSVSLSQNQVGSSQQRRDGVGVRARWSLIPQSLDRATTLTGGLTVGRYVGNLPNQGWSIVGTLSATRSLGANSILTLGYDYSEDALGVSLLGRHRLTGSLMWSPNNQLLATGYLSHSLDKRATSYVGDLSWRLSDLWRLGSSFTWQRFGPTNYRDTTFTLAYRVGFRELALSWSSATRRWSFDILTAFY